MSRCRRPFLLAALGSALLFGAVLPARAAALAPLAAGGAQPIQIQADSGIEWDQNARLYIARGHAVAIRGDEELHADTLIAHYRKAKGGAGNGDKTGADTEIYRVDAEGHVLLKRNDDIVVGDNAVYDIDQGVAVVTGKNLKLTTPSDVVTARDSLEWYDQRQIAVARGDAVATRNGKTVKGDVLTAYLHNPAPAAKSGAPRQPRVTPASAAGGAKISRVDAQGHVVVSNGVDAGRGDFGVYNADSGIATLIGHVVIERGRDVIRGQRGVMDLNRNISRMLPGGAPGAGRRRVEGLFVRAPRGEPSAAAVGNRTKR